MNARDDSVTTAVTTQPAHVSGAGMGRPRMTVTFLATSMVKISVSGVASPEMTETQ